jgi:hypothetical protein
MDDFSKYESMRDKGTGPEEVYRTAKRDGFDPIALLRLLRKVFSLSLPQAKEVTVIAEGLANSLEEYQEKLSPGLEQALAHAEDDRSANGATSEAATGASPGLIAEPSVSKGH